MLKSILLILTFFSLSFISLQGQELDWLKSSTSNDQFTSHSFYTSTQHNDQFYFAGDFWKDMTIDGVNIEILDDSANGFILKMDEAGNNSELWHFSSNDYVRINSMKVNPITESLIITGYFRENLILNNQEWIANYYSQGFVISMKSSGDLEWLRLIEPMNDFSFASGEALEIDQNGNIYVGVEAGGTINIDNASFSFQEETLGVVIAKLDSDGNLIESNIWTSLIFEGFIDIADMEIDNEDQLIVGGAISGSISINDSIYNFPPGLGVFISKQNESLEMEWMKTYPSTNSNLLDIHVDDENTIVSIQYNTFINIDGKLMQGTGSWGETAIISIDNNANLNWARNFTLTENSGNNGVYGQTITGWKDEYYIGGMYQGDVIHDGEIILDNSPTGPSYQYPFIISLNKDGFLTSIYDFNGSSEPCRIKTLASNNSHLVFGGDFYGQVSIGDTSVNTINSALFYGALSNITTNTQEEHLNDSTIKLYPSITSDYIFLEPTIALESISLFSSNGSYMREIDKNNRIIDVRELLSGSYYLSFKTRDYTLTRKFVKQ